MVTFPGTPRHRTVRLLTGPQAPRLELVLLAVEAYLNTQRVLLAPMKADAPPA